MKTDVLLTAAKVEKKAGRWVPVRLSNRQDNGITCLLALFDELCPRMCWCESNTIRVAVECFADWKLDIDRPKAHLYDKCER